MGDLVYRQGPSGYVPSGEPRGMLPASEDWSVEDWLRNLLYGSRRGGTALDPMQNLDYNYLASPSWRITQGGPRIEKNKWDLHPASPPSPERLQRLLREAEQGNSGARWLFDYYTNHGVGGP